MRPKIHDRADVIGCLTAFALIPGHAHDLEGADLLLSGMQAEAVMADKGFSAEERMILSPKKAAKGIAIPSKDSAKEPRIYDKHLYKAKYLIEIFLPS